MVVCSEDLVVTYYTAAAPSFDGVNEGQGAARCLGRRVQFWQSSC